MKICIFERSNEKNHFSKRKIYFRKKSTPQLLGHIGLQSMKVEVKVDFGWLAAVCLMYADISSLELRSTNTDHYLPECKEQKKKKKLLKRRKRQERRYFYKQLSGGIYCSSNVRNEGYGWCKRLPSLKVVVSFSVNSQWFKTSGNRDWKSFLRFI